MQNNGNNTTHTLAKAFGMVMKYYRTKQDKTIYKISAECSINKESWRLIENGLVNDVKLSTLWKIADGLEVSQEQLISDIKDNLDDNFCISD